MDLGLVPQTLYLFRMKRWQLFQGTYSYFIYVKEGGMELFWRQHPAIWQLISWAGVTYKAVTSFPEVQPWQGSALVVFHGL